MTQGAPSSRRPQGWAVLGPIPPDSAQPRDSDPPPDESRPHVPEAEDPRPLGKPRPGHGTVYVSPDPDPDGREWWGSWQDDLPHPPDNPEAPHAGVENQWGTEDEVLEWARTRPAKKHLIRIPAKDYMYARMPLDPGWRLSPAERRPKSRSADPDA
jgi:hypothetical protein